MTDMDDRNTDELGLDMQDLITLTARLAQLLAEEADMLAEMKISQIDALQKEKTLITNALEKQRKYLDQNPHLLEMISPEDREDLEMVSEVFNAVLRENYRRLLVAREVNQTIVQAIADTVGESTHNGFYDDRGHAEVNTARSLSVTLNKTV